MAAMIPKWLANCSPAFVVSSNFSFDWFEDLSFTDWFPTNRQNPKIQNPLNSLSIFSPTKQYFRVMNWKLTPIESQSLCLSTSSRFSLPAETPSFWPRTVGLFHSCLAFYSDSLRICTEKDSKAMDSAGFPDEETPLVADNSPIQSRMSHTRDVHILSCAFLLIFLAYGAAQNLETSVNTVSF